MSAAPPAGSPDRVAAALLTREPAAGTGPGDQPAGQIFSLPVRTPGTRLPGGLAFHPRPSHPRRLSYAGGHGVAARGAQVAEGTAQLGAGGEAVPVGGGVAGGVAPDVVVGRGGR